MIDNCNSRDIKLELLYSDKLKEILWNNIFKTLSEIDKSELLSQIERLDNIDIINNGIKIRVKPWFIKLLRKVLWVHDIKWWAYWWTSVYLGDKEDLFNEELLVHESIHVKQQAELSKNTFLWFVKWLIYSIDSMKKYKEENSDKKNVNYESTIMIPTELEAYAYSDNPSYILDRDNMAFKKYETNKNQKDVLGIIEDRNYKSIFNDLKFSGSLEKIDRLEEIMKKTKNAEYVLYIFNNVDEVNQLLKIEKLISTKLVESQNELKYDFNNKMHLLIEDCDRELNKFNLSYLFEDENPDIVSLNHLKEKLEEVRQKIKEYKRVPARFWLEDVKHRDSAIDLWFF